MRTNFTLPKLPFPAGAALALAGCLAIPAAPAAWAQDASPVQQQTTGADADLQSKVTSALVQDPALQGQQVKASTDHGIVTLSGRVQTEQQRQAAETAAANVQGVSGIQNNITVAEQAPAAAQSEDDGQAPPPPDMDGSVPAGDQAQQPSNPQAYPEQSPGTGPAAGNPPPPPADQSTSPRPPYQSQGGYSPRPYPQRPYSQQQPGYGNYPPPQPVEGPVTIPAGTLLQARTMQPVDISRLQPGTRLELTAASDVFEGNVLAIPRGAMLGGSVVDVKKPGSLSGSGEIQLQIESVTLRGRTYPLSSDVWSSKTPNKGGYTARNTAGGAVLGAIIGGIAGGGPAAAAGAIVGGGAGMAASAASHPRNILPPEALLNFHLASPVTVQPVSWQEAERLAHNAEPQLRQRRIYMRPYPYPYPYGYPYPYPYYRVYGW